MRVSYQNDFKILTVGIASLFVDKVIISELEPL